ncbi:MAG: mechanosensitive ion channel [Flexilinea sp.]|nr:mechanosensitive ion channel [Flexilinea sp.]
MKKNKTLIAFVILILLLAGFVALALSGKIIPPRELSSRQELKVSSMVDTIKRVEDQVTLIDSQFSRVTEASADLMAYALAQFVTGNGYEGPEILDNGVVVRIEKGTIVYPRNAAVRFPELKRLKDLEDLSLQSGTVITSDSDEGRSVYLTVKPVTDGVYYLEWTESESYQSFVRSKSNFEDAVRTLEKSYDLQLLLIQDQAEDLPVIYHSEKFGAIETLGDLGITGEILASEPSEMKIGETVYKADYEDLTFRGQPVKAIVLSGKISSDTLIYNCIVIAAGFILLTVSGLILWIHWVEDYVRDHTLTEEQKRAYRPAKLRKTAAAVGINGALLLLVLVVGYQLMGNLTKSSASNQEMLDIIMARLEHESRQYALEKDETEAIELSFARRVAGLYEKYPELRNREFLAKAAELTSCEFIMVFDMNGDELLSSNAYVGFSLGREYPSTEDFRFLLQGVDQICHEPVEDPYTGKMIQMAGVWLDTAPEKGYEAMVFAFDWKTTREDAEKEEIAGYINMLTPDGYLSLIIDQETGRIVYSSNTDYVGSMPGEIGLDETDLIPTSLEPFEILKRKTYGAFNENDQYRCYYIMEAEKVWGDTISYGAASAVAYLVICLIISLFMLGPSQIDLKQESALMKEKLRQTPSVHLDKKAFERQGMDLLEIFQEPDLSEQTLKEWWRDLTPEKKISRGMSFAVTVILAVIIVLLIIRDEAGSGSVIGFILTGSWKHGVNDLALMSIFCVLLILAAFILLKSWLLRALCAILNAKGETIARLISSLLQYLSIITAICFCLSYLGFDTGTLITSAGILTLAISLGSKDLVADILSGIFIIFEGDFHVGDIIEVNGFKGRVLDIGVRSTKLIDSCRNIKIIDNQSVKNVLNLSKENTWFFINLTISNTQPLHEIEDMLDRELPKVGEKIPRLISGPYYFGIDTIGYRRLSVTVAGECRQQDVNGIKSQLNHELWEMFEKNGYQL